MLRFCEDEDLLKRRPDLDRIWPRADSKGARLRDWSVQIDLAMEDLATRLRNLKDTSEPFELGRLDPRSQERLRPVVACWALYHVFVAADTMGDDTGFFARQQRHWLTQGDSKFKAESLQLDYDTDRSGTTEEFEKDQPFPSRFVRGG